MILRENPRVVSLERKLREARAQLHEALAEAVRGEVRDYAFETLDGPVTLFALFRDKRDLFVIHNMGSTCPQCTMWADGFNGLYAHIADRAACVVASPDAPETQATFAASRGWRFPMISTNGTTFAADMGFADAAGRMLPGVSVFQKQGGRIVRVSASGFDAGEAFGCPIWHLFGLLPEGVDGWKPKISYESAPRPE
jgi:predicted dithiol-disulfide oxidoreductase (DUF899 family)